jgi:hypothetical protein
MSAPTSIFLFLNFIIPHLVLSERSCRNIRSLETVMHIPFVLCDDFTVLAQSLKGYSAHLTIIATHATHSNRQVD